MRKKLPLLLCSIALICTQGLQARQYYVALNGNNNNPGTITQPWRTIAYATGGTSGIAAGDTIFVRAGNYPEIVTPSVNGTAADHIVIMNYRDEVVTMNPGRFRFNTGRDYWTIRGLQLLNSDDNGIYVTGTHAIGCLTVQNCVISHHREDGIQLGSPNFGGVTVEDCVIEWNGESGGQPSGIEGSGIVMYGSTGKVWLRRNLIAHNWAKGISHGSATEWVADSSVIDSNLIIDNFESGMDWWGDNSYIRYNYFSLNGTRDTESEEWGDKGLALANQASGNLVAFNVIKSSGRWELEVRGSNNRIYNNTIIKDHYYTTVPGSPYAAALIFWGTGGTGNEFRNNIIANYVSQPEHHFAIIAETYTRYTAQIWSNNLYWCPNSTAQSPYNRPFKLYNFPGQTYNTLSQIQAAFPNQEIGSIYASPSFVSLPDSNFTLALGSPAIDAGLDVGFPFNGQAPDIGRFEFSSGSTPPWISPIILDFITDEDQSLSYSLTPHEHDQEQTNAELTWSVSGLNPQLATAQIDTETDLLTITPLPDQNGSDVFTLTLSDGQGGFASQNVNLIVNPVNDPPWIEPDVADFNAQSNQPLSYVLTPHEHDVEQSGTQLIWTASGLDPGLASISINPVTDLLTITPVASNSGSDEFTLQLSDGQGGVDSQAVLLTVTFVNTPPWIDPIIPNFTTLEDQLFTFDLTSYEHDNEQNAAELTWSALGLDPALAAISIHPATDVLTITPVPDQFGSDDFILILSDGAGGTDSAQVTLTVTPVNDPPWIDPPIADFNTTSNQAITYSLTPHEQDIEQSGAQLIWAASGLDPGLASISINPATDLMTITPVSGQNGSDEFMLRLSDGQGGLDSQAVFLTVNFVNTPPWIDPPVPDLTTLEDEVLTFDLTPYEHDQEQGSFQLTWAAQGLNPALASVTIQPATDLMTITPVPNQFGADAFTLILSDGFGGTDSTEIQLTVVSVNDPPFIQPVIADITIPEDEFFTLDLTPYEHDVEDSGAALIWSVSQVNPQLLSITIDPATDEMHIVPPPETSGADTILLTLRDSGNLTASQNVVVTVEPVNDPPWIEPLVPDQYLTTYDPLMISLLNHGHDMEDPPALLQWEIVKLDTQLFHAEIDSITKILTLTPIPDQYGVDSAQLKLTDTGGSEAFQDIVFSLMAAPGQGGPKIAGLPDIEVLVGTAPDPLSLREYVKCGQIPFEELDFNAKCWDPLGGGEPELLVYVLDGFLNVATPGPLWLGIRNISVSVKDSLGRADADTLVIEFTDRYAGPILPGGDALEIWQIAEPDQTVHAEIFLLHVANLVIPNHFASFQALGGEYADWTDVPGLEEFEFRLVPNAQNQLSLRIRYANGKTGTPQSVVIIEDSTPPQKPSGLRWLADFSGNAAQGTAELRN